MDAFAEAYVEYLEGVVPLSIWHAWDRSCRRADAVPLDDMLEQHTDLWRKTKYYGGKWSPGDEGAPPPDWMRMKADLTAMFDAHRGNDDSAVLEAACWDYLWPLMEPCVGKNARPPRKGPDRPFGCWTYYIRQGRQVSVHIANVYQPESPFERIDDFAGDLLALLTYAHAEHPEADLAFCGSWLNNLPPFQALFPPVWAETLAGVVRLNGSNGIWGQYMDRRETPRHRRASQPARARPVRPRRSHRVSRSRGMEG